MKQFVMVTDDMFYRHPELYDRLVPFSHSVRCRHLLQQPLEIDGCEELLEYSLLGNGEKITDSEAVSCKKSCQKH